MKRNLLVIMLLIGCTAAIALSIFISGRNTIAYKDDRVFNILKKYEKAGLMSNQLVNDTSKAFKVPKAKLDFSHHKTLGEVLKEIREIQAKKIKIEDSLDFKDYVCAIAKSFLDGTVYQDKVQINEAPKAGYLNIYFLNDDPDHLTPHFRGN